MNNTVRSFEFALLFVKVALMSVVALPADSFAQVEADNSAITPRNGPIRLFDGESLRGFDTWLKDAKHDDPDNVFRVTDGLLHFVGDGLGAVITRQRYRDYHLILEYKWGKRTWHERATAARDSGLLIHSNGKLGGYEGIWMPSIEVQIIEGGVGDLLLVPGDDEAGNSVPLAFTCAISRDRDGEPVWNSNGEQTRFSRENSSRVNWFGRDPDWQDKIGVRGPNDKDSPLGQWTRLDVLSDSGHLQVFVNGTKVNEAREVTPHEGQIQLQSELAEIYFRRWELWPIANGPRIERADTR